MTADPIREPFDGAQLDAWRRQLVARDVDPMLFWTDRDVMVLVRRFIDTIDTLSLADASEEGLDVERLARATFLYRTSSNVPLPPDYWERQSPSMREPFIKEAAALVVDLRSRP